MSRSAVAPAHRRAGALLCACTIGLTACTSSPATAPPTTRRMPPPTTTTTTAPEQPGWTTLARDPAGIAVDRTTTVMPDGSTMTFVRFLAGHVTFDLHIGSLEPPTGGAAIGPDSGPSIGAAEAPSVLACFNAGFKVHDDPGGIVTWGQALTPIRSGFATFAIDAVGHATVGVWGQGLPTLADPVLNVRQNLQPLLVGGTVNPAVNDIAAWGFTYGGGTRVARSALGEDAAGDIVYVASMGTVPADLAQALLSVGAVDGMQLDINPATLQMDTASTPGGTLTAQIPGQQHPSDQCQIGSQRDFIVALAAPGSGAG